MAINFQTLDIQFHLDDEENVRRWIKTIITQAGMKVGCIGYLFCDDAYLLTINQKFLQHDTYTDIITFDYVEGDRVSGDILISIDRVGENARLFDVPFSQELHRVVIHGVLHLLGQADKSEEDAAVMRSKENKALHLWESMQ